MKEAPGTVMTRWAPVLDWDRPVDREIGDQGLSLAAELAAWKEGLQKVRIPKNIDRILALGTGSAYHAALAARQAFATAAGIPMEVVPTGEFRVGVRRPDSRTLILVLSNSEETAETLAALRRARAAGAPVLAMVKAPEGPVSQVADFVLPLRAGPESNWISTKTYTSQLLNLLLLALHAGHSRGVLGGRLYQDLEAAGERLPIQAEAILCRDTFIRNCARKYQKGFKFLFIGRREHHAAALEAAYKMKEFCPGSAPAASAAVLDRKTMALIDHRTVVVVIAPRGDLSARLFSALGALRTRGAIILTVATDGDRKLANESNHVFEIPDAGDFWSPLLEVLPLQLLARHRAHELRTS